MSDWCAGCDHVRPRRDMKFVAGTALYRCNHCRRAPAAPRPARPRVPWPRVAQIAAAAFCVWAAVDTSVETTGLQNRERDHIAELRRQQDINNRLAERQRHDDRARLHTIDYPPVGATTAADGPTEANGSHYHCEQETFATGISLPTAMGTSCSFRWPDGSIAPPPARTPPPPGVLTPPAPMTVP